MPIEVAELLRRSRPDAWASASIDCREMKTWERPFSDVREVIAEVDGTALQLIVKQNRICEANRFFQERGDPTRMEYLAQRTAFEHFNDQARLGVAEPLACDSDRSLFLMRHVAGRSLEDWIGATRYLFAAQDLRIATELFHRLGAWLRHYQTGGTDKSSVAAPPRLWRLVLPRVEAIAHAAGSGIPDDFVRVMEQKWDELASNVGDVALVPCHGDFGPWNVLVQNDGAIVVLDFFCQRDDLPWLDLFNVTTYLDVLSASATLSASKLEKLKSAFVAGYGGTLNEYNPAQKLCLAYQQLCRLQDASEARPTTWRHRRERHRTITQLVRQLLK